MNIGVDHKRTNNLSEALVHCARAIAIFREVLPPDHPGITLCMNNIADVNAALGNFDDAAAATAAAASTARRSQVQCAAGGCPRKLKADGTPLDQCGGCKRCYYCSRGCQTAHWKAGHKAECKELRGGTEWQIRGPASDRVRQSLSVEPLQVSMISFVSV